MEKRGKMEGKGRRQQPRGKKKGRRGRQGRNGLASRVFKNSKLVLEQRHPRGALVLYKGYAHNNHGGRKGTRRVPLHSALSHDKRKKEKKRKREGKRKEKWSGRLRLGLESMTRIHMTRL